jgi:2-amino-4-hydroxy-6-hydroxymethyldihydropteridine diphosphokinase
MDRIYLLLGTNIGDLEENLLQAMRLIDANGIRILKKSKIYRTKPWGVEDQPDFLNLALEAESGLSAIELMKKLKLIETQMGRKKTEKRWQPRLIDIDILFWGDKIVDHAELEIPHREFFNRPFAMKILSEIAPDFVPPGAKKALREQVTGECDEGVEVYRN